MNLVYKDLVDYIDSKGGINSVKGMLYEIGLKFKISPPDIDRAEDDDIYKKKAIIKKIYQIYINYIKEKNDLKLSKETYNKGELVSQTFKRGGNDNEVDVSNMQIERVTSNPHGGSWVKYKNTDVFNIKEKINEIKDILKKDITPIDITYKCKQCENALFIYGSDKHIGAFTKENSIYQNKYDKKVITNRIIAPVLDVLDDELLNINEIFVMDLGDALDGFNGRTTRGLNNSARHTLPQQYDNVEQYMIYLKVHKQLFDILLQDYKIKTHYVATSASNHGGDFDYTAMYSLKMYLDLKYKDVKAVVTNKFIDHFIYGKHCIIFSHGKDEDERISGLPLTLNAKTEKYINDYIDVNNLGGYYITFVSGDLHQSAETNGNRFRYKKVLSQYGGSKWVHSNFGTGKAGLSCEVISKKFNVIKKRDIYFDSSAKSNTGIKI